MGLWRRSRSPESAAQDASDLADAEVARAARVSASAQLWAELGKYAEAATMGARLRGIRETNHFSEMIADAFREGDERDNSSGPW